MIFVMRTTDTTGMLLCDSQPVYDLVKSALPESRPAARTPQPQPEPLDVQ